MDHFLKPLVNEMKSYVKDTTHLLNIQSVENLPTESLPVTYDVNSLYTSIPRKVSEKLKLCFGNAEIRGKLLHLVKEVTFIR